MQKKISVKLASIIGFIIIAAIFVGPRVLRDDTNIPRAIAAEAKPVSQKIGKKTFDNMVKATLPPGYAVFCIQEQGEQPGLTEAVQSYNVRNQAKMVDFIKSLREMPPLSAQEKAAIDQYAYAKVQGDVKSGAVACDKLAKRIESGEWDF